VPFLQKPADKMSADKTTGARNDNKFIRQQFGDGGAKTVSAFRRDDGDALPRLE
jgi:hypothetical protein